jgi:hypothetical protein
MDYGYLAVRHGLRGVEHWTDARTHLEDGDEQGPDWSSQSEFSTEGVGKRNRGRGRYSLGTAVSAILKRCRGWRIAGYPGGMSVDRWAESRKNGHTSAAALDDIIPDCRAPLTTRATDNTWGVTTAYVTRGALNSSAG